MLHGKKTHSITALGLMTLGLMTLGIATLNINDTQHDLMLC